MINATTDERRLTQIENFFQRSLTGLGSRLKVILSDRSAAGGTSVAERDLPIHPSVKSVVQNTPLAMSVHDFVVDALCLEAES